VSGGNLANSFLCAELEKEIALGDGEETRGDYSSKKLKRDRLGAKGREGWTLAKRVKYKRDMICMNKRRGRRKKKRAGEDEDKKPVRKKLVKQAG